MTEGIPVTLDALLCFRLIKCQSQKNHRSKHAFFAENTHSYIVAVDKRARKEGYTGERSIDTATIRSSEKVFSKCFCFSEPVNFIPPGNYKSCSPGPALALDVEVCTGL